MFEFCGNLPSCDVSSLYTIDVIWLTMLRLYVREADAYPHRAFLAHPFELVRRTDHFFLIPWRPDKVHIEEVGILKKLLDVIGMEQGNNQEVCSWIFTNIDTALGSASVKVQSDFERYRLSPADYARIITHNLDSSSFAEDDLKIALEYPLCMVRFISSLFSNQQHDKALVTLVQEILRTFWHGYFVHSIEDDLLICCIASHLGFSDLFPVAHQIVTSSRNTKSDPFLWILAILTIALFASKINSSLLGSIFELAMTRVTDSYSALLLLLLLARVSCGDEISYPFINRLLTLADTDDRRPKSSVEDHWVSYPWYQSLNPPLDEFLQLNISPVTIQDDSHLLLIDL